MRNDLARNRATLAIHCGYEPENGQGAVKPPIFPSTTYVYRSAAHAKEMHRIFFDENDPARAGPIYARLGHPNLTMVEARLAALDGAEACACFNSGMAAITAVMHAFLRPGRRVLYTRPIYGGTDNLLHNHLSAFGVVPAALTDPLDPARLREDATAGVGPIGLIHVETPANPTAAIADIAAIAAFAAEIGERQESRPLVSVDNTFLGPFLQSPLAHGADFCITSLTKYAGGHSDLLAGGVSGGAVEIAMLKRLRMLLGSHLDPQTSWLLLRSFETLGLRTERAAENAAAIAEALRAHPKVAHVTYLGFAAADPRLAPLYARQCRGAGSTFSFALKGGEAEAFRMLDALRLIKLAVSLGGTETLICHSASTTHYNVPSERRAAAGITEGTMRLSVGIEHIDDLLADLDQALEAV
jgi:methionine-gamma-lyase